MVWVKLDDEFFDHPKNRAVGKDGRELLVASLCHANRHGTDGLIADHDVPLLAAKAEVRAKPTARTLLQHGRWHRAGHDCPSCPPCPDDVYLIHDYEDFQQEAMGQQERRRELSAKRAEAGRKGARKRWQPVSDATDVAMANGKQTDGKPMAPSPVPYQESQSSSELQVPGAPVPDDDDDDLPDGLWAAVADRKIRDFVAAGGKIKSQAAMRATTERNARTELGAKARQLTATYELSTGELVEVLCAASTPHWLAMSKRRNTG